MSIQIEQARVHRVSRIGAGVAIIVHLHVFRAVRDDFESVLHCAVNSPVATIIACCYLLLRVSPVPESNPNRARSVRRSDARESVVNVAVVLQNVAQQEVPWYSCAVLGAVVLQPDLLADTHGGTRIARDGADEPCERGGREGVSVARFGVVHGEHGELLEGTVDFPIQGSQLQQCAVLDRRTPRTVHAAGCLNQFGQHLHAHKFHEVDLRTIGHSAQLFVEMSGGIGFSHPIGEFKCRVNT